MMRMRHWRLLGVGGVSDVNDVSGVCCWRQQLPVFVKVRIGLFRDFLEA